MLKSRNRFLLTASLLILLIVDLIYFISMGLSYLLSDLNLLINELNIINFSFFVYQILLILKNFLFIASIYIILKQKRFLNRKKIVTGLTIFFIMFVFLYSYLNLWIVNFDTSKLDLNVYSQIFGILIVVLMLYFMTITMESRLFVNIRTKYFYIIVVIIYTIIFAFNILNYLSINSLPYVIFSLNIIFTSIYLILKMNITQRDNRESQVSLYK